MNLEYLFLKYGVKQNNLDKQYETPSIITACFNTLDIWQTYDKYGSDDLYADLIKFITENGYLYLTI